MSGQSSPIIKPRSAKDERRVEIQKHGSGGIIILIGDDGVLLPPRNAYMVGVGILKALGITINEHWHDAMFQGDHK